MAVPVRRDAHGELTRVPRAGRRGGGPGHPCRKSLPVASLSPLPGSLDLLGAAASGPFPRPCIGMLLDQPGSEQPCSHEGLRHPELRLDCADGAESSVGRRHLREGWLRPWHRPGWPGGDQPGHCLADGALVHTRRRSRDLAETGTLPVEGRPPTASTPVNWHGPAPTTSQPGGHARCSTPYSERCRNEGRWSSLTGNPRLFPDLHLLR